MFRLTMHLNTSAQLLGTEPQSLLECAEREQLDGLLRFNGKWMVSVFTLAHLLGTSSDELLEVMEDYALGALMDAVKDDEVLEGEASWQAYQEYLQVSHPAAAGCAVATNSHARHAEARRSIPAWEFIGRWKGWEIDWTSGLLQSACG